MLKDKVEPIAEYGDEENGNKIDTSAIELDNADTFDTWVNGLVKFYLIVFMIIQNP